jgi:hypothetical protein
MSLVEVVISVFLLAAVGLTVMSMASTAVAAQKRNLKLLKASLIAQSKIAEIRLWAADINNYLGNWAAYQGSSPVAHYPDFQVQVRANPGGRPLQSPCQEFEEQWAATPQGQRTMPKAIVPVEVTVSWGSSLRDQLTVMTYVAEPKRDLTGVQLQITDPNPVSLSPNAGSEYEVTVSDGAGRPFENLLFSWAVDSRYLSITSQRDGRRCRVLRDRTPQSTDPPPPTPPETLPTQCYASYAGEPLPLVPKGLELP